MSTPQFTQQFGRKFSLLVSNRAGKGLDLSELHVKFAVKKSGVMTPNVADIRVYNLNDQVAAALTGKELTQVVMQAGYVGNFGVIFKGNIKQAIAGREDAVTTFVDLICGDGDQAYNFAVVNKTLAKGSSQNDRLSAAAGAMSGQGVSQGYTGAVPASTLPRGKVMFGNARDYMRTIADSTGSTWSIQDESMVFLSQSTYLPGEAVVLTSKTGMVGTPQQTVEGIMCKCFINPKIRCHGRIKIDNKSVQLFKLDQFVPGNPANTPVPLTNDGVYYVLVSEFEGDTRGVPWYTSITSLNIDVSSNPLNSVKVGQGS